MLTMDVSGLLSGKQIDRLSTVYIGSLTFSLIASFSVLVVSIVKWTRLRNQGHLLVQLSLADLLAALVLMSTSAVNKVSNLSENMCQYSLLLSLTFYLISFLLMVVYAWKSRNIIQGWRVTATENESQCRQTLVAIPIYIIVWVVPLAFFSAYVISFSIKGQQSIPQNNFPNTTIQNNSCILLLHIWVNSCSALGRDCTCISFDGYIGIILLIVVTSVTIAFSFIYSQGRRRYEQRTYGGLFPLEGDGLSRRRCRRGFSTALYMVVVILICWAPALVLILLSFITSHVEQSSLFGLYCVQAATVSLQGFLNSIVFAWGRPNFTEAVLRENTPLLRYNHRAFFDESLAS